MISKIREPFNAVSHLCGALAGLLGSGLLLAQGGITANYPKIFAGSLAVSLLAVGINYLLRWLEFRSERAFRGMVKAGG